jgi:hypothetical protein
MIWKVVDIVFSDRGYVAKINNIRWNEQYQKISTAWMILCFVVLKMGS